MERASLTPAVRGRGSALGWGLRTLAFVVLTTGCASWRDRDDPSETRPGGRVTDPNRAIRRAIRQSSEGVILLPSKKAEKVFELPRLNEIAHELRGPAAVCFLRRAIETMKPDARKAEQGGFVGVPEGQVKIRTRISPGGEVLRTEVLESGFSDGPVVACIEEAINAQKWPPNKTGNAHFIDIVYWVSLGMQADVHSEAWRDRVKREEIGAGVRAKQCLQGRVGPGSYAVQGLNLVDREGSTMANRIDPEEAAGLPDDVRACVARAFRDIRLAPARESFVRPVVARTAFVVAADGSIAVDGEEWLRLMELEERARREAARGELAGDDARPRAPVDAGEPAGSDDAEIDAGEPASADDPPAPAGDPKAAKDGKKPRDPGQGGLRLDLGARPGGE
jgi:hypothetical protein